MVPKSRKNKSSKIWKMQLIFQKLIPISKNEIFRSIKTQRLLCGKFLGSHGIFRQPTKFVPDAPRSSKTFQNRPRIWSNVAVVSQWFVFSSSTSTSTSTCLGSSNFNFSSLKSDVNSSSSPGEARQFSYRSELSCWFVPQ